MHVDVDLAKIFRIRAELAVAATDEAERGLHRFLHHFADVTCKRDIAFPGVPHRFNVEHFAAGRRVSESGDNARLTRFEFCLAHVFGWSQQVRDFFRRNGDSFSFSARDLRRHGTTDRADLTF